MVVANATTAATTGWPVGFWASELTHPYYEFTEAGYDLEIVSPDGGKVELDAYSDPRHESGYSADDLISMGFLHTPALTALLEDTKALAGTSVDDYDAIVVAGGQSPMFTFRRNPRLQALLGAFHEAKKVTAALCHGVAALCHGVAALMDVKISNGEYLISGKTMTGFSNAEEESVDRLMGQQVMPWRVEDVARSHGANYVSGGLWRPYAVRDGRLVTGQQQYSGRMTAALVMEALGV